MTSSAFVGSDKDAIVVYTAAPCLNGANLRNDDDPSRPTHHWPLSSWIAWSPSIARSDSHHVSGAWLAWQMRSCAGATNAAWSSPFIQRAECFCDHRRRWVPRGVRCRWVWSGVHRSDGDPAFCFSV